LELAARMVEKHLNDDHTDHKGSSTPCQCGAVAIYSGRHPKTFMSILGEITLKRAYYYCAQGGGGFFPRDRAIGVTDTSLSPGLTRMIGISAAMVSFAEASELLLAVGGLQVPHKTVERAAKSLGAEIFADERTHAVAPPMQEIAPTMYGGLDGTGIPMRPEELAGRKGKQADGSAKTREVKLCAVWSAESRDRENRPLRDEGSVSYSGAIESAACRDTDTTLSAFAQRVLREALRRGVHAAPRQVVIGDGAPWIWNFAHEHFPHAVQIVDRFHVKEYLCRVGKDIYGPDGDLYTPWYRKRHQELDEERFEDLLGALSSHTAASNEAQQCIEYLRKNRHRMRYCLFENMGPCTSSGVLEAGCKTVIGNRLKRSGMRWSTNGANYIIALRCCKLSGRFEDFWERRSAYTVVA
jgi:hypothetical protein